MYPEGELTSLAQRKAGLRRSITRHRAECVEAALTASRPLTWIDTAYSLWRVIAPLAKFGAWPLGGAAARTFFPGQKILRFLLRWAPVALSAFSAFKKARKNSWTAQ
jgi:hypothetical protein